MIRIVGNIPCVDNKVATAVNELEFLRYLLVEGAIE